jgi:hypothetical protein
MDDFSDFEFFGDFDGGNAGDGAKNQFGRAGV